MSWQGGQCGDITDKLRPNKNEKGNSFSTLFPPSIAAILASVCEALLQSQGDDLDPIKYGISLISQEQLQNLDNPISQHMPRTQYAPSPRA